MRNILKLLKFVAFLVVSCLIVTFVSCNDENPELTQVEVWYNPSFSEAGPPPSDWAVYGKVKSELGINLKLKPLPAKSTEQTKVLLDAAASGKLPDLFSATGDAVSSLIRSGDLAAVESAFDMMPNRTSKMYDAYSRKVYNTKGHSYVFAQPSAVSQNEGILIRKDWLDKLGLEIPVTLDDFFNVMKDFTFKDPDGNGKDDTYGFGAFIEIRKEEGGLGRKFQPFFGAFGVPGTFCLDKNDAGLTIYKPGYYNALEFIKKIYEAKVIDPNWDAYGKDDFRNAWKSGRFGIMREQNAAFALESNYKPFDEAFPDGEWIVVDAPEGPDGRKSVGVFTEAGHRLLAVSKKAEPKLSKIAELLEWMSSDEGYHLLGYGVEGENYTRDSAGRISVENLPDPAKAYSKPEMMPFLQLRNFVFYNSDEELEARYPEWTTKNGKKLSAYKILEDMREKSWTDGYGMDLLPSPSADLKKFVESSLLDFVRGNRNLTSDNWNAWLSDFDAKGGAEWNRKCVEFATERNLLK